MFQNFEDLSGASGGRGERIGALRKRMKALGLDIFLVPQADEHQGEYVPESAERLLWLTGFSGSAGLAAIGMGKAALFVDGRYTLQSARQVDKRIITPVKLAETTPETWLKDTLKKGDRLGYDPWLHTVRQAKTFRSLCAETAAELVPVTPNPVDGIWPDRPPPPVGQVFVHPPKYAGRTADDKLEAIRADLGKKNEDACILTQPDSIAWAFNIRGRDVPHNPVALAFAIIHAGKKADLFIDAGKLDAKASEHLKPLAHIHKPSGLEDALAALGGKKLKVRLDPARAADFIATALAASGADVAHGADPCLLPKAIKNAAELRGARAAHSRDGVAMCRFLAWLDREAPGGTVSEIDAARRLEECRAETGHLRDISFDTISGAGPNGAIVHYRVNVKTNRKIRPETLYLVDSGGQYQDGTTDVTRTIAIGQPNEDMRAHFTLVLRGHIAVATARFPKGTTGAQLDALARRPLWQHGLDFDHGTGHGVGSFLSVHEGPQYISKAGGGVALEPGMIVSNEPGFYRAGKYGIRIENLVAVKKAQGRFNREMLEFETLTLAPIDLRLVETRMMSEAEVEWLDGYHASVFTRLSAKLGDGEREWLAAATAPLKKR